MAVTATSYFNNEYTFSISGSSSDYLSSHAAITSNAIAVIEYLANYISWKGSLDFVVKFDGPINYGPNGTWTLPIGNGLLPAYGGIASDGKTFAQVEALTGKDANGSDFDVGLFLLPNVNGSLTNYGNQLYIDPNPEAYKVPNIPAGTHDFFSIFLHETLHGLGIWSTAQHEGGGKTFFDELTAERNGQFYFEGDNVTSLLGESLPLAIQGSRDHYGLNQSGNSPIDRGAVFEVGNYEQNRWHLGQIDLAILRDLGYTTANGGTLPLTEQNDQLISGSSVSPKPVLPEANDSIMFTATSGPNIFAGTGSDDSVLMGIASKDATISLASDDAVTSVDRNTSGGTDNLISIEKLIFIDRTLDLTNYSSLTQLNTAQFSDLAKVYVAYFNRAADAEGLYFWADKLAEGMDMATIASYFSQSAEAKALYPDTADTSAFVTAVYANVLGRTPDQAGFDFWTTNLNNGTMQPATFVLSIIGGAVGPDITYLSNKADLGVYFAAIKGMSDVTDAQNVLNIFGDQATSNTAGAKTSVDGHYSDATASGGGEFIFELVGIVNDPFAGVI